ncbi:MAG: S9 family peptidase [Acidobacteriota bacterium]|nr:S9 family peptidase [Acidobacteriota bacterium]
MKLRVVFFFSIVLFLSGIVNGGENRRFTVEDFLSVRSVGAPQWSPDGRWIAFTVTDWDKKNNGRDTHIYLVSSAGGQLIRLTNGESDESNPQWSPDGARIAFLANRGGGQQIWVIPINAPETEKPAAEKLTNEENGISDFAWSPDGKSIAFTTRDTPADKAERDKRKKERFDAIVVDSNFIYSHLWVIDVATKEKKRLTEGAYIVINPQWSPDSKRIAFHTNHNFPQESSYKDGQVNRNSDIFIVSTDGSKPRLLTTDPAGYESDPIWSPDGKQIAFRSRKEPPVNVGTKTELMTISPEDGTTRVLTLEYNDSIYRGTEWSPDGRSIYVWAPTGVHDQVLKFPVSGGAPQPIFERPGIYSAYDISPDGQRIAYIFEDSKNPADIWVANVDGKEARKLTNLNPQINEISLGEVEVVKWKGVDGLEIEGILVKPADYQLGKRYPLIVNINGGPGSRWENGFNVRRSQVFAANGYAMLFPNIRGTEGYGYKFLLANEKDWGGKDFQDILTGVDAVIKKGVADENQLAIMGHSYGGFMTFWAVTQTDRFKAAIGHAGISDWFSMYGQTDHPVSVEWGAGKKPWIAPESYRKFSPITYVERVKTPLLITHGEQDRRVPIAQAEQYYRSLKRLGKEVVFVRYPRATHGISEPNHLIDLIGRQLEWFDKHVKVK